VLPFDGPLGRAVMQTFMKRVAENPDVKVLDLPNGSASDRMVARFLRERAGTNRQISNSLLKRVAREQQAEKLAVMKGGVTTIEVSPVTMVDPVGACLGTVTGSMTPPKVNPVRVKIGFDAKFLDINNAFATITSVKGFGEATKQVGQSLGDQLMALVTLRNIALIVAALIVIAVLFKFFSLMFRVR
ncbi:MAG: hypothetical protein PHU80_05700, partial [Kiritimatiellae bacterium]|nr:hypothetical protein [Kiritimatiellia bacterium]